MYATLLFDVEDLVTTESDDVVKWLADILHEEGLKGTFLVVAEKARLLEARGRFDVLDALKWHDLGSHTDTHSIHPTVSEYLANKDWNGGVKEAYEREVRGFKDLERIFGKEMKSLGQPGGSYGPQLVYALGRMGKAYVYSPVWLPNHNILWFCGALNFSEWFGGFDQYYTDIQKFDEKLNQLGEYIRENHDKGVDWIGVFCCHPTTVRALKFWDAVNLAQGQNPPRREWKYPPLKTEAEMEVAKSNFRRLVRFLKENSLIEVKTISELMELYSAQVKEITKDELASMAKDILKEGEILVNGNFSPAETLTALAESILSYVENKALPNKVRRREVLGPMDMPIREPEIGKLTWKDATRIAEKIAYHVREKGALPGNVEIEEGRRVGIASVYLAFADISLKLNEGVIPRQTVLKAANSYPSIAEKIEEEVRGNLIGWIIHKPDLNQENIVKYTKLQTWTLKPAHRHE